MKGWKMIFQFLSELFVFPGLLLFSIFLDLFMVKKIL